VLTFALAALLAVTSAPADQYFGKLKMSALRIRYETMQLRKRYETHELLPEQAEHLLSLTQDAFGQWSRAYPKDSHDVLRLDKPHRTPSRRSGEARSGVGESDVRGDAFTLTVDFGVAVGCAEPASYREYLTSAVKPTGEGPQ
jgi:hypothetical protein